MRNPKYEFWIDHLFAVSLVLGDLPLEINTRGRNRADEIQNKTEEDTYQTKTTCSCQTQAKLDRLERRHEVFNFTTTLKVSCRKQPVKSNLKYIKTK